MGQRRCIAICLSKMQDETSLTLCWSLFLGGSSDTVTDIIAHNGSQHHDYGWTFLHSHLIIHDARPQIVDILLPLIVSRW